MLSYGDTVREGALRDLAELLAELVPEAVDCPEEPWVGPLQLGDLEIRCRPKGPLDVGGLNCLVEEPAEPTSSADRLRLQGINATLRRVPVMLPRGQGLRESIDRYGPFSPAA